MKGRGSVGLLLAVLACSACSASASKLGAYMGCFDIAKSGWISGTADFSKATRYNASTISQCRSRCANGRFSLAIVTSNFKCRCSIMLPPDGHRVSSSTCKPVAGKSARPAAVYYLHKDAGTQQCRLASVAMDWNAWSVDYAPENVQFNNGELRVRLNGYTGSRLTTNDGMQKYGQWQVQAKIAGASGVVSACYSRSSDVYPNTAAGAYDEIDLEWINAGPTKVGSIKQPGTMWFHSYKDGKSNGERGIPPSEYMPKLGLSSSQDATNTYITYSFNWQPDFITWAANGVVLRTQKNGTREGSNKPVFYSPNKAQKLVISVWARDPSSSSKFGGPLDWSGMPYYSYFKNVRRVLCDRALPNGLSYLGPQWLTAALYPGGTYTPPPPPSSPLNPPRPPSGTRSVALWGQCGGKGGTCEQVSQCSWDAPWTGFTCASRGKCNRNSEWYWQCMV